MDSMDIPLEFGAAIISGLLVVGILVPTWYCAFIRRRKIYFLEELCDEIDGGLLVETREFGIQCDRITEDIIVAVSSVSIDALSPRKSHSFGCFDDISHRPATLQNSSSKCVPVEEAQPSFVNPLACPKEDVMEVPVFEEVDDSKKEDSQHIEADLATVETATPPKFSDSGFSEGGCDDSLTPIDCSNTASVIEAARRLPRFSFSIEDANEVPIFDDVATENVDSDTTGSNLISTEPSTPVIFPHTLSEEGRECANLAVTQMEPTPTVEHVTPKKAVRRFTRPRDSFASTFEAADAEVVTFNDSLTSSESFTPRRARRSSALSRDCRSFFPSPTRNSETAPVESAKPGNRAVLPADAPVVKEFTLFNDIVYYNPADVCVDDSVQRSNSSSIAGCPTSGTAIKTRRFSFSTGRSKESDNVVTTPSNCTKSDAILPNVDGVSPEGSSKVPVQTNVDSQKLEVPENSSANNTPVVKWRKRFTFPKVVQNNTNGDGSQLECNSADTMPPNVAVETSVEPVCLAHQRTLRWSQEPRNGFSSNDYKELENHESSSVERKDKPTTLPADPWSSDYVDEEQLTPVVKNQETAHFNYSGNPRDPSTAPLPNSFSGAPLNPFARCENPRVNDQVNSKVMEPEISDIIERDVSPVLSRRRFTRVRGCN